LVSFALLLLKREKKVISRLRSKAAKEIVNFTCNLFPIRVPPRYPRLNIKLILPAFLEVVAFQKVLPFSAFDCILQMPLT
jgi:hypothetical protein